MKNIFPFLFVLIFPSLYAQNYRVFNPGDTAYYSIVKNMENYGFQNMVIGLRSQFDTILSSGQQEMNFGKTLQLPDSGSANCHEWTYFFIGPKLWIDTQGRQFLVHSSGDSLLIVGNENVNDKRTFLEFNASKKLTVTRLPDSVLYFQSVIDSTYRLELHLEDSSGKVIPDNINGQRIVVSKKYGLVEGVSFYSINYSQRDQHVQFKKIKMVGHEKLGGIKPMTQGMLYDYEIGDEFHTIHKFITLYGVTTTERIFWVYDKIVTGSTIRYKLGEEVTTKISSNRPTPPPSTKTDTTSLVVNDTNKYLFNTLPGEADTSRGYVNFIEMYQDSTGILKCSEITPAFKFNTYNDSCISRDYFEHSSTYLFIQGVGFEYYSGHANSEYRTLEYVYIKKKNYTWGFPLFNNKLSVEPTTSLVYPNPASKYITVDLEKLSRIQIMDMKGRVLFNKQFDFEENTQVIELPQLHEGNYLIKLELEDKIEFQNLQIINP